MRRLVGVLMVLAVFGAGYLSGACSSRYEAGASTSMGVAVAAEDEITATSGDAAATWHDDFEDIVKAQLTMDQATKQYVKNAHAISLTELLAVVLRNIEKEEKNLIIVVTDEQGNIMPAEKYRFYIRGYKSDGGIRWAEDFPPILYP